MYWSTIYVEYIVLANLTIFKKCGKLNKPKYSVFFTLRDFALRLRVFHHTVTYAQSKALRNMTVDSKNYVGTIHCLTFRIFTIHCLVYTIHCLVGTIHSRTGTTNFVHNAPSIPSACGRRFAPAEQTNKQTLPTNNPRPHILPPRSDSGEGDS